MPKKREVYLAYTRVYGCQELLAIYSKSAYCQAYNWLADIGERYDGKLPTPGNNNVVVEFINPANGQRWWLERHEVI